VTLVAVAFFISQVVPPVASRYWSTATWFTTFFSGLPPTASKVVLPHSSL